MPLDLDAINCGELRREDCDALLRCAYPAVLQILSNRHDIEGIMQEALIKFVRRGHVRYKSDSHAIGTFRRIAKFTAIDLLRRELNPNRAIEDEDYRRIIFGEPALDQRIRNLREELRLPQQGEFGEILRVLIQGAGLSGAEPDLLVEVIANGMTERDFADRHGLPRGTINYLKQRVLLKVRQFLSLEHRPGAPWLWGPDREL